MAKNAPIQAPMPPRPVTPLGLIAANLENLCASATALGYTDSRFVGLLDKTARLAGGLDPYITESSSPASGALAKLAADTALHDWASLHAAGTTGVFLEQEMVSGHIEGRFLNMLVRATRATRILEIGLFTGYSALAMAEALPENGRLVACEIDAYAASVAQRWFDESPHGRKIRIEIGPARTSLECMIDDGAEFDFIFIDADKASYAGYLESILGSALLAENGLICVDNTLLQGEPYLAIPRSQNGEAIAHFNRYIANDDRIDKVLLPIRDGITLIRRVTS